MRTFSKIYGLAGLRLGYGIAQPELIAALEKVRQPFNINAIAQAGALAALDDTAHVAFTRQNNKDGLRFFEQALRKLNREFIPSAANFILVRVGDGLRVFNEMQKAGVIVRPLGGYHQMPEWILAFPSALPPKTSVMPGRAEEMRCRVEENQNRLAQTNCFSRRETMWTRWVKPTVAAWR